MDDIPCHIPGKNKDLYEVYKLSNVYTIDHFPTRLASFALHFFVVYSTQSGKDIKGFLIKMDTIIFKIDGPGFL